MEKQLQICYADGSIAVCVKPAGADSQSAMPAMLRAQLGGEFFCVHRLDRDVGGVMVYARTAAAASALGKAVAGQALEKTYLAVCAGRPEQDSGTLRDLLYHDAVKNKTFVVKRERRGVREAILDYRVLDALEDCTLAAIRLHTGRSHQIRVQFASRGMPLLGDARYGSRIRDCGIALWSHALCFPHPLTGETLRFTAPPPQIAPWTRFHWKGRENA